jgi:single-stranded DNA-binding protein
MLDCLIAGKLFGKPQSRTSKSGNPFVTAKMRVPMEGGVPAFANIIGFRDSVVAALLALDDGAAVAISGELKISTYTDKHGATKPSLDVTAHEVLTEFHVTRRRKAMSKDGVADSEPARNQPTKPSAAGEQKDFDDSIPF